MPPAPVTTATTSLHIAGRWVPSAKTAHHVADAVEAGARVVAGRDCVASPGSDLDEALGNEGTDYWESHLLFGGRAGSTSGVGRVGGRHSLERSTELKTIVINLA